MLASKAFGGEVKYGATLVFMGDTDALKYEPFAAPTSESVKAKLKALDRRYYIKQDLRKFMEG